MFGDEKKNKTHVHTVIGQKSLKYPGPIEGRSLLAVAATNLFQVVAA